jgi:CRISPR-associated protein Cmr2
MSQYLFLFAISPVQAYIEQARKTQDLYAGSYILSHLCHTAIQAFGLKPENIIFPAIDQQDDNRSLPNRFIALVEKEETELERLGKSIEDATKAEFHKIAATVLAEFKDISERVREQINEQITQYLTVNWLCLPLTNGDYLQKYAEIERLFGAIKRVRGFEPLSEKGRKCSICGERNVRLYHKTERESQEPGKIPQKLFSNDAYLVEYEDINYKLLQPGEGLCVVCYMKRNAGAYFGNGYNNTFPSTPEIALLDALSKLPDAIRPGKKTEYDAHVVFALHNHTQLRETYPGYVIQASQRVLKGLDDYDIPFSPYYAVLRFDGDSMGKWLSGEYLRDKSSEALQRFHPVLSGQLRRFAHKTEKHFDLNLFQGCSVYAGGDDFLGFLNLNVLFPVMKQFRQEFDKINLREFTDAKLTFSAGIVIAHYKTPLVEVLKWSQRMEHEAKAIDARKDAFAVAVLKHSGEIRKTVFKWRENDIWTPDMFNTILTQIKNDNFSATFIANLEREFSPLMEPDGTLPDPRLIYPEIKRLLSRSCQIKPIPGESKPDFDARKANAIQEMVNVVNQLLFRSRNSFDNFLSALQVIDFLARKAPTQLSGEVKQ